MRIRTGIALPLAALTLSYGCGSEQHQIDPNNDTGTSYGSSYDYSPPAPKQHPKIQNISGLTLKIYKHSSGYGREVIGSLPAGKHATSICAKLVPAEPREGTLGPYSDYYPESRSSGFYFDKLSSMIKIKYNDTKGYIRPVTTRDESEVAGGLIVTPNISPSLTRLVGVAKKPTDINPDFIPLRPC